MAKNALSRQLLRKPWNYLSLQNGPHGLEGRHICMKQHWKSPALGAVLGLPSSSSVTTGKSPNLPGPLGELNLKLDLQGHPNVTFGMDGSKHTWSVQGFPEIQGSPHLTCSRVVPPTLSARMARVLSRPVADLSLAALESRSA